MKSFFGFFLLVTIVLSCTKQGNSDAGERILCALPPPMLSLRIVSAATGADLIASKQLDTAAISVSNEQEEKFKFGLKGNDTLKIMVVPQFSYKKGDNPYLLKAGSHSVPITVSMIYGKCGEYIGEIKTGGVKVPKDTRGFYIVRL